jgi:hypothetical protein
MNDTAPVLTLRPPVDASDLARMLVSLRPGKRLVVSVDGEDIVVREAWE